MKAHGRQLTVTPKELARLEQAFGSQSARLGCAVESVKDTMETLRLDRREHPELHEHDAKWADNHYAQDPVPCPGCGAPTKHFVQARSLTSPTSVTLPACIPCTKRTIAETRQPLRRRHAGKKSHTRGTDLL